MTTTMTSFESEFFQQRDPGDENDSAKGPERIGIPEKPSCEHQLEAIQKFANNMAQEWVLARGALRKIEWGFPDGIVAGICPGCGQERIDGHKPNCVVGRALGTARQVSGGSCSISGECC